MREELDGAFLDTSREGYRLAQDISSYSLTAVARACAPLMGGERPGAILTLSYLGGERVVPHYNVMGIAKAALEMSVRYLANDLGPRNIRVNAISAGPIKTLAGAGVKGMGKMIDYYRQNAPLRRASDQDEVGDAGLFLVSPMSRGVTGEVLHVDSGFHVMAMGGEVAQS
jgi:enoyl-[acyl-carrier protein] reductase I